MRLWPLVVLAAVGCAQPERGGLERPDKQGPPVTLEARIAEQRARAEGKQDPWPWYDLALLYEEAGDVPRAVQAYGNAINRLPPRTWTSPMLRLGLLHHRTGNVDAAARCYEEVLATVATEPAKYRTNPDYRQAALGLKALREAKGEDVAALRARFTGELGGAEEEWAAGPPWLQEPAPAEPPR